MSEQKEKASASSEPPSLLPEQSIDVDATSVAACAIMERDAVVTTDNTNTSTDSLVKEDQDVILDESDDSNTDKLRAKTSRELKSLLALSKEAKLDTNITHKRVLIVSDIRPKTPSKGHQSLAAINTEMQSGNSRQNHEVSTKATKLILNPEGSESSSAVLAQNEANEQINKNKVSEAANENFINKRKRESLPSSMAGGAREGAVKRTRKTFVPDSAMNKKKDGFCWRCHRDGISISCETCPRSFHQKCLKQSVATQLRWLCPECVLILKAENIKQRSPAMQNMTLEHLCGLLKFALKRMMQVSGCEPFIQPVSTADYPEYTNYVVQPMDLTRLEKNIKDNLYGSTQAFETDAKCLLHNSIIFNSYQSKFTIIAKRIIKICKQEMAEIENCASCYLNANTKKNTWFVEVCPKPHLLVWAKLKGFPYWPAKAMCTNSAGMVDVRFFGAHDRAWVPSKECFLYSIRDPNPIKLKRVELVECIKELDRHVEKLKEVYGEFSYAPYRIPVERGHEIQQLQILLPNYNPSSNMSIPSFSRIEDSPENTSRASPESEEIDQSAENDPESSTNSIHESSEICGYGTEDEDMDEDLDQETQKEILRSSDTKELENSDCEVSNNKPIGNKDGELDIETQNLVSPIRDSQKVRGGKVRTRGGYLNATGKIKIIPKQVSLELKRPCIEEDDESPSKISRSNSEHSNSSRISNISDKINRVDISENMEITLGNNNSGNTSILEAALSDHETSTSGLLGSEIEKRKPIVQLNITANENKEFTISPQSKISMADRLMKKLAGAINEQQDMPNLKTDSVKKRLHHMSDKLKQSIEGVTENGMVGTTLISKVKSRRLTLLESDEPKQSIAGEPENGTVEKTLISKGKSRRLTLLESDDPKQSIAGEPENGTVEKTLISKVKSRRLTLLASDDPKQGIAGEPENGTVEKTLISKVKSRRLTLLESDEPKQSIADESKNGTEPKKIVSKVQSLRLPILEKVTELSADTQIFESDLSGNTNLNSGELREKKLLSKEDKGVAEKAKLTHTSNNLVVSSIEEGSLVCENATDHTYTATESEKPSNKDNNKELTSEKAEESCDNNTVTKNGITATVLQKEMTISPPIIGSNEKVEREKVNPISFDESSEELGLEALEDTQINETDFRNIIHSSLNLPPMLVKASRDEPKIVNNNAEVVENGINKPMETEAVSDNVKTNEENLKRKRSTDGKENNLKEAPTQNKFLKLVDVDAMKNKISALLPQVKKTILEKELTTAITTVNRENDDDQELMRMEVSQLTSVLIKSEPSSEDDTIDTEYMEAKRKYLSALNISARVPEKPPKQPEIRTRSKAQFKIADNLSKVINEVALNSLEESAVSGRTKEISVKPLSKMQAPKQKARKSFPMPVPMPTIKCVYPAARKEVSKIHRPSIDGTNTRTISHTISFSSSSSKGSTNSNVIVPHTKSLPANSNVNTLPPNQPISYTANAGSCAITMVQNPVGNSVNGILVQENQTFASPSVCLNKPSASNESLVKAKRRLQRVEESQNFIPQSGAPILLPTNTSVSTSGSGNVNIPVLAPLMAETLNTTNKDGTSGQIGQNDESYVLNGISGDFVSKTISEIVLRGLPKLKPKPPGPLSAYFDEGIPSSAGVVAGKINSISHRLNDYLRGMMIELLQEMADTDNPHAEVVKLRLELEELQYKHSQEIVELKKNLSSILQDVQNSIVEERTRLVDETRTLCEAETVKQVEEAKSKQWCANCSKEAQFYCCWNTSYCDYPCQQKHWAKHMSKCTQNIQNPPNSQSGLTSQSQPLILRPTTAPKGFTTKTIMGKPTKVIVNRPTTGKNSINIMRTSSNSHITLVESTPGNYELVGNGPISVGGKFMGNTSIIGKIKSGNVISVTTTTSTNSSQSYTISPSTSGPKTYVGMQGKQTISIAQKPSPVIEEDLN